MTQLANNPVIIDLKVVEELFLTSNVKDPRN